MPDTPRWRRVFRLDKRNVEADVNDEVSFHFTMQVRDLMAEGLSREAAEAEALRRFGNPEPVRRELLSAGRTHDRSERRLVAFAELRQDLRFALRQLARRPVVALVTVGILGLGIGANAAVFRVVDGALLRPLPMPDEAGLVYSTDRQNGEAGYPASWPEYEDWKREGGAIFRSITAFAGNGYVVQYPEGPEMVIAGTVAGDFLGVLGVAPLVGRGFDDGEMQAESHVLMLSEETWRRRFRSDPTVVGKTLLVEEAANTIIGVMPTAARILVNRRELEFWKPLILPEQFRNRGFHLLLVAGRLHAGVPFEEARSRAAALTRTLMETNATTHGGLELAPVRETLVGDSRKLLLALQGAVAFLLLIVCANLANLFLLQAAARGREFAIRTAIGAGRMRLVRQLLTEAMLLGALGGVVGVALSTLAVGLITAVAENAGALAPEAPFDPRLLAFTLLLAIVTALLFGLTPARRAGQSDIAAGFRSGDGGRAGQERGSVRHRKGLVVAELAMSLILLCGSALMIRSVMRLLALDPGFRPDHLLTFSVGLSATRYPDAKPGQYYEELLTRISALPGVSSAAAVSHLPLGGDDTNGGFGIVGRSFPPGEGPSSKKRTASPGYFTTMGIPLIGGRDFDARDRAGGRQVVVISETVARRYWPGEDPIGREINFGWGPGDPQEIVGIVGDVRHDALDMDVEGAIYRPVMQYPRPGMSVVVRTTGEPFALASAMREAASSLDPLQPVQMLASMESVVGRSIGARRTLMVLLSVFAGIALVLAGLGVYTVTSQSVAQRRREIGVRMAVGARGADVLRMVLREEMAVVAIGIVAGLAGAWGLTRVLAASLYQISPRDAGTYGLVAGLLAAIALAAILIPAIRASRVDPVVVLRSD